VVRLINGEECNGAGERGLSPLPGQYTTPYSRGCISCREGRKLVETANDIIEELGGLADWSRNRRIVMHRQRKFGNNDRQRFIQQLFDFSDRPITSILLIDKSGLTADAVSIHAVILELASVRVASLPGGTDYVEAGS